MQLKGGHSAPLSPSLRRRERKKAALRQRLSYVGHLQPERFDGDGQRVPGVGGPLRQDVWRRLKQQRVGPLGAVGVGLSGSGTGQRSLDEDVQGDGRGLAGRLGGGAGGVSWRWEELLSPGRGGWYVGGG